MAVTTTAQDILTFAYNKSAKNRPGTIATDATDPAAAFRIASVTKTFTAAAILRLVEDHRLALDDTVAAVAPPPFPDLLRRGHYDPAAITVRELLQRRDERMQALVDLVSELATMDEPRRQVAGTIGSSSSTPATLGTGSSRCSEP